MVFLIILVVILIFVWWSTFLPFYKDKDTRELVSDESKCFSPDARSIIYDRNRDEAVLLIHGFPTTPKMYSYATEYLDSNNYDCYAPLIPTFGSRIEEFEKSNFTQWFNYISSYYEMLRKRYKRLYVLGVSMGGAMSLKLAEKYSNSDLSPDKIVVLSAPITINNYYYRIVMNKQFILLRALSFFKTSIDPKIIINRPNSNDGNEDWNGYDGIFIKQILSLAKNLQRIRKDLKKINCPMYIMHDKMDKTVPFRNLLVIEKYCKKTIRVKREVEMKGDFKHSRHSLLMYHSVQKQYMEDIVKFIKE